MMMAPVVATLIDEEARACERGVAVSNQAALHRRKCAGGACGACCMLGEGIQQGGSEHVAGDAADRVEVEMHGSRALSLLVAPIGRVGFPGTCAHPKAIAFDENTP